MSDMMSDALWKVKRKGNTVEQLKCNSQLFFCRICILVLFCVLSSIYILSERPHSFTRSSGEITDSLGAEEETVGTEHVRESRGHWNSKYAIKARSRLRRSLPSSDCKGLEKVNITNGTVVKGKDNASCHLLLYEPPSVQNVTSRKHEVFFPLKISNVLDVLLQQAMTKKHKGTNIRDKHKRNQNISVAVSKDKAVSSYIPHPHLYVGGYVRNPKQNHLHDRHPADLAKKRTTTEGDNNNSTYTNTKHKTDAENMIPEFPEDYHASGLLILPHSGIAEPFEIWYAPSRRKSRIDYYYGTDKTYQLGDYGDFGSAYKYVPMYNDRDKGFDGCWAVSGTQRRPVVPQIITPNITWFKYNGTTVYTGTLTTRWVYQYYAFGMRNSQTVWITKAKPNRPIRYEMFGFDMMLGSYYDHYVIEYISFEKLNYLEETFELPRGIKCFHWGFSLESSLHVNPMQEFSAFSPESVVDTRSLYEGYKAKRSKRDKVEKEKKKKKKKSKGWKKSENRRLHVFHHHARLINSHNRKNATFKLKPNQFVILTREELEAHHGQLEKDPGNHAGILDIEKDGTDLPPPDDVSIPEELDWREYGAVSHVKGQGICGACYAFTAAGAAEGAWYRKTGSLVEVSSQQILDCSWGYGNHGCKGGHYASALSWIYTHGISTDKSYGKFLAQEGYCHFNDTWFGASIDGFSYIQPWNKTALKIAVAKYGPIAVSINTRPLTFKFYSHGIYNDPKCVSNQTTHSALVVGYGKEFGEEYWIVKNSWSSTWGENGYIKVSMKDNLCGITEYPVAVVVYRPQFQLPHKSKARANDRGVKIHPKQIRQPLAKFNPTLNVNPSDNNGGSTTTYYKATYSNKQSKPFGKYDQDTQSSIKSNKKHKEKEGDKSKSKDTLELLSNKHKEKEGDKSKSKDTLELLPDMSLLNDTSKINHPEDEKKVDGLSYMGSRDENKDIDTFSPDKQNETNVAVGDDMEMKERDVVQKEHLEGISSSGDDVNETRTSSQTAYDNALKALQTNENDLDDNRMQRVNLTLSLFRDGIFNTKLFDALLKDEINGETNNTNEFALLKDEINDGTNNTNEFENERNENVDEEGRSEEREVKINKTDAGKIERKMKKEKAEDGKINEKLGKIEKELKSDNMVEERNKERRKALLKEREEEMRELQAEERRKALLEERKEELEEVEKEINMTTGQKHLGNSSEYADFPGLRKLQEEIDINVERKLKEIEKIEKESKEDQEGEQSIEHEVTKAARRRKEMEEEKKVELEEAWKAYLEKERKKKGSQQNTSPLVETRKLLNNKSKSKMKDGKNVEKLKNNIQTKEQLNEEIAISDDSGQYGQDEETVNEDAVQVRMKRLLHQQKEIHKLIRQLRKLHVTGDKKSIMYALHWNPSVDPEKVGLYTTTLKGKRSMLRETSRATTSTALKKWATTSTALKKYNIYFPQKKKKMPRLFSPIRYISTNAKLFNFDEKKRQVALDTSQTKQFLKVNRKRAMITSKEKNLDYNKMKRIGININKMRHLINMMAKRRLKKMKKQLGKPKVSKAVTQGLDALYTKIEHDLVRNINKIPNQRGNLVNIRTYKQRG